MFSTFIFKYSQLYHRENRPLLHSLSSSLISTYPSKINALWFNYSLENIVSSISSCDSSQTYTSPNLISSPLNLFEDISGISTLLLISL